MIVKTYDHVLQLPAIVSIQSIKLLAKGINIFKFIYNSIYYLTLAIGGLCLLILILVKQRKQNIF